MASADPVLYVEDEENDVLFMQRAFRKLGLDTPLEWVSSGPQAIAYLSGEPPYADRDRYPLPRAILLDLNLGFVSGFEVLEWLRAQTRFRTLPVVIFSSSNNPRDKEKALSLGANDYISKPQSSIDFPEVLIRFQRRWLAQGQEPLPDSAAHSSLEPSSNAPWTL